ncbi:hypothetical protein V1477_002667 [Vespula maculifrons]|uniref:Uncharacterized protein n=1 Tax=Vespula maculifrons TaxID=7453 RepID=A0ABD2CVF8_VESMC
MRQLMQLTYRAEHKSDLHLKRTAIHHMEFLIDSSNLRSKHQIVINRACLRNFPIRSFPLLLGHLGEEEEVERWT